MHPILIDIAGLTISTYSVVLAVAVVTGVALAVREGERRALPITYGLGVWALLGALVGARAFWIVQFSEASRLWQAVLIWSPGLVFYGGLFGGFVTLWAGLRLRRAPMLASLDAVAPYAALGEGIARVGCFFAGCCWGMPCERPWSITFPADSYACVTQIDAGLIAPAAPSSLPVHPTQIYMLVGLLGVFVLLKRSLARNLLPGAVALRYLLLYGALRFVVEMFRGDSGRPLFGMTVSQVISLALFLGAIAISVIAARRTRRLAA